MLLAARGCRKGRSLATARPGAALVNGGLAAGRRRPYTAATDARHKL